MDSSLFIFLAREEGLEPPAYGFGDRRSTKLSYSRIFKEQSRELIQALGIL